MMRVKKAPKRGSPTTKVGALDVLEHSETPAQLFVGARLGHSVFKLVTKKGSSSSSMSIEAEGFWAKDEKHATLFGRHTDVYDDTLKADANRTLQKSKVQPLSGRFNAVRFT